MRLCICPVLDRRSAELLSSQIFGHYLREFFDGQSWLGMGVLTQHPENPSPEFGDFTDSRFYYVTFWSIVENC